MEQYDFMLIHAYARERYGRKEERSRFGIVGPILEGRLEHGLYLWERKGVRNIIVAGRTGFTPEEKEFFVRTGIPITKTVGGYLEKRGVPTDVIVEEDNGENTYDCTNHAFKEIIIPRNWRTAHIISTLEHLPRIAVQTQKVMEETGYPLYEISYSGPSIYVANVQEEIKKLFVTHERSSMIKFTLIDQIKEMVDSGQLKI